MCGEKVTYMRMAFAVLRITPACAGKSQHQRTACQSIRDHPRMCGEKFRDENLEAPLMGSPPHVRGKDRRASTSFQGPGITPACAGKS